jgi:hypothetical protein
MTYFCFQGDSLIRINRTYNWILVNIAMSIIGIFNTTAI